MNSITILCPHCNKPAIYCPELTTTKKFNINSSEPEGRAMFKCPGDKGKAMTDSYYFSFDNKTNFD